MIPFNSFVNIMQFVEEQNGVTENELPSWVEHTLKAAVSHKVYSMRRVKLNDNDATTLIGEIRVLEAVANMLQCLATGEFRVPMEMLLEWLAIHRHIGDLNKLLSEAEEA